MIDYARKRAVADRQIRKWGAKAYLRRVSDDRECWALEVQLNSSERRALKNLANRIWLISAIDLEVPPTKDDSLVIVDQVTGNKRTPLRFDAPVRPLQPQPGGIVIYYELETTGSN